MRNGKNISGLNEGIYNLPEVSYILDLPQATTRRWINKYWEELFASDDIKYTEGKGRNKTVNFHTLIEIYVFYQLKQQHISLNKIKTAHHHLQKKYKEKYPFATYTILSDGANIFYESQDKDIITADQKQQIAIKKILEKYCKQIDFDDNNLAERFWPLGKEKNVVVDPKHKFGQPVIKNTNIEVFTIFGMFKAGESRDEISYLYDLTLEQINDAIDFCNRAA